MDPSNLIKKFRSIGEEPTLGETFRGYNQFTKEFSATDCTLVDSFFENLQVTKLDVYQKNWFVKLLDQTKQEKRIIEILKGDDKELQAFVLKYCSWFFNQLIAKPQAVVSDLFHQISATVRKSVVRKICICTKKNPQLAKQWFDAVNSRYGISFATALIVSLAPEEIANIVRKYGLFFDEKQRLKIAHKRPDFFSFLYSEPEWSVKFSLQFDLEWYIGEGKHFDAKKRNDFFKLFHADKYGRKRSRKIISALEREIIETPKNFQFLHPLEIAKINDLQRYFANILPKDFTKFQTSQINFKILDALPFQIRFNVLNEAFVKNYARAIVDLPIDFMQWSKLLDITPLNERVKIYEKCMSKTNDEILFIELLHPEKVEKYVLKKIHLQKTVTDRARLYQILIRSIRINEMDTKNCFLKDLLNRHKNEQYLFFLEILQCIDENWTIKKTFYGKEYRTMDHFMVQNHQFISDIIKSCQLQYGDELSYSFIRTAHIFLEEIVNYKLKVGLDIQPELMMIEKNGSYEDIDGLRHLEQFETFLVQYYESIGDDLNLENAKKILLCIFNFNKLIRKYKLSQPIKIFGHSGKFNAEILVKTLVDDLKKDEPGLNLYGIELVLFYLLSEMDVADDVNIKSELEEYYWKEYEKCPSSFGTEEITRLLKHKQINVKNHIETILKSSFVPLSEMLRFLRKHKLIEGQMEKFREKIQTYIAEKSGDVTEIVQALKFLAKTDEFPDIIQPLLPTEEEIDIQNQDSSYYQQIEIQKKLPKLFKLYRHPSKLIDASTKFLKKDYKKFGLGGLYTVLFNLPQWKLEEFLDTGALDKGVSLKKHKMYVILETLDNQKRLDTLTRMITVETNQSLKSYVLLGIFRLYNSTLSSNALDCFKLNLQKIEDVDQIQNEYFAFDTIMSVQFEEYLLVLLGLADRFDSLVSRILQNIHKREMMLLSAPVAETILKLCFYTKNDKLHQNLVSGDIVLNYVLYAPKDAEFTHLDRLLELIERVSNGNDGDTLCLNEHIRFNMINDVVDAIYSVTLNKEVDSNCLEMFEILLQKMYSIKQLYFDRSKILVVFSFVVFWYKFQSDRDYLKLISNVVDLFKSIGVGTEAVSMLRDYRDFIKDFLLNRISKNVVDKNLSRLTCLEHIQLLNVNQLDGFEIYLDDLTIAMLPDPIPCENDPLKDRYFKIINVLKLKGYHRALTEYYMRAGV